MRAELLELLYKEFNTLACYLHYYEQFVISQNFAAAFFFRIN